MIVDALKEAPDSKLPMMASNPQYPVTSSDVAAEMAKRAQLRMATPPAPASTNPMGAQPIGQTPPPAGGILNAVPNQQNPMQMASGGIVPFDPEEVRKHLQGEIDRRAKGGQIKHYDFGGTVKSGLRALLPTGYSKGNSLLAQYLGSTGSFAPEDTEFGNMQPSQPTVADIINSGVAPQVPPAQAELTPEMIAAASTPIVIPPRGAPPAAVPGKGIAAALIRGNASPASAGLIKFLQADAAGAPATDEKTGFSSYLDQLRADPKQSAQMQAVLDKMDANRVDPMQRGLLSGIAQIAQGGQGGGWQRLGRGVAGGIGGYQSAEDQQMKNDQAVAAERLKMMQGDISEENANKRAAMTLSGQDTQADRAAQVAAWQMARDASRERMNAATNAAHLQGIAALAAGKQGQGDEKVLGTFLDHAAAQFDKNPTSMTADPATRQSTIMQNGMAMYNQWRAGLGKAAAPGAGGPPATAANLAATGFSGARKIGG